MQFVSKYRLVDFYVSCTCANIVLYYVAYFGGNCTKSACFETGIGDINASNGKKITCTFILNIGLIEFYVYCTC